MAIDFDPEVTEIMRVLDFIAPRVMVQGPLKLKTGYREEAAFVAGAVALFTGGETEWVEYSFKRDLENDAQGFFHVSKQYVGTVVQVEYVYEQRLDED